MHGWQMTDDGKVSLPDRFLLVFELFKEKNRINQCKGGRCVTTGEFTVYVQKFLSQRAWMLVPSPPSGFEWLLNILTETQKLRWLWVVSHLNTSWESLSSVRHPQTHVYYKKYSTKWRLENSPHKKEQKLCCRGLSGSRILHTFKL